MLSSNCNLVEAIFDAVAAQHSSLSLLNNAAKLSVYATIVALPLQLNRTRRGIERADIVVVRFGDQYKQWNAAFDAGYAAALGKSLVILHGPDHAHALKEVDAAALAVASEPEQVVDILRYVLKGTLPG